MVITAASAAYLNHSVERTAHSLGSVPRRSSVPVGRRSPQALDLITYRMPPAACRQK
jgi:hypothetical protein